MILNEVHSEFVPNAVQPGFEPAGSTTHQPIKPIQQPKVQEISEIPSTIALQRPQEAVVRSHVPPSNPGSIANQIHERHKRQVLQNPPKPKAQRPKKIKKVNITPVLIKSDGKTLMLDYDMGESMKKKTLFNRI